MNQSVFRHDAQEIALGYHDQGQAVSLRRHSSWQNLQRCLEAFRGHLAESSP